MDTFNAYKRQKWLFLCDGKHSVVCPSLNFWVVGALTRTNIHGYHFETLGIPCLHGSIGQVGILPRNLLKLIHVWGG